MNPTLETLDSGVRLACDPMPGLASMTLMVAIGVGTRWETSQTNGVAHLLEHMAFKGAGGRSARGLAEAIERLGASVDAATSYERTCWIARGLSEDAPALADIVADMVLDPHLDASDLERERNVVLQEIAEADDLPDDRVMELHQSGVFADQPLGRPILGTPETLDGIGIDTLAGFHRQMLDPSRMVISVAGSCDLEAVRVRVAERFGALRATGMAPPLGAAARACALFEERDTAQAQLMVSWDAPAAGEDATYAARLACEILGGGASSRLFQEVREARGLVYGIDSWLDLYADVGRFGFSAACDPRHAREVMQIAAEQLALLAEHGPTEDELARAKAGVRARILMGLESPSARAEARVSQVFLRGAVQDFGAVARRVAAVTADEVRAACARVRTGALATAVLGRGRALGAGGQFAARFAP